jgi:hypothetical protein
VARFNELLGDDTNQFGPGTDLTISLLAVVLVISLITSHLYRAEKAKRVELQIALATGTNGRDSRKADGGNFKLASEFFTAADFHPRPVTRLRNPGEIETRIARIARDYRSSAAHHPFIFVIGHSNELDDPDAENRSANARRRRNMEYALRRAVLIADLLQANLTDAERQRLVVASTGEFDLKNPTDPQSQENAWVEVVFGREWKLPDRIPAHRGGQS